ncbi:MAG TPA: hypothetical protein VF065_09670, partial [Ilumatobacter sp.]
MLRQPVIALLVAAALGCSPGTAVGGSDSATGKASLQIVRKTPLTIRGRGFRAGEHVRVSASGRNWRLRATR